MVESPCGVMGTQSWGAPHEKPHGGDGNTIVGAPHEKPHGGDGNTAVGEAHIVRVTHEYEHTQNKKEQIWQIPW